MRRNDYSPIIPWIVYQFSEEEMWWSILHVYKRRHFELAKIGKLEQKDEINFEKIDRYIRKQLGEARLRAAIDESGYTPSRNAATFDERLSEAGFQLKPDRPLRRGAKSEIPNSIEEWFKKEGDS